MKKHEMMDKSLRYFDALRGIWIGLNRGLYRESPRKEMEKECLNGAQRARWQEAYSIYLGTDDYDEDADTFTALGDILQLLANVDTCDLRQPYKDLRDFCRTVDVPEKDPDVPEFDDIDANKEKCSMGTVLENFSKNAFVLMGKGSTLAQTIKEFPAENPDQLMVQSMDIGESLGTFLKVGIDFQ